MAAGGYAERPAGTLRTLRLQTTRLLSAFNKSGPPQNRPDRLLRRIGRLADPTGPPDLVTTGHHTRSCATRLAWKRASMAAAPTTRPTAPDRA